MCEEFGQPAHTYAPVYTDGNIGEILDCSSHLTFNSLGQFRRFGAMALLRGISCGLRVNPRYSPSRPISTTPAWRGRGWA